MTKEESSVFDRLKAVVTGAGNDEENQDDKFEVNAKETKSSENKQALGFGNLIKEYFFRVFLWNLPITINVSESEKKKISQKVQEIVSKNKKGEEEEQSPQEDIENHELFDKLCTIIVWRNALIVTTIIVGLVVFGIKIADTVQTFDYYNYLEDVSQLDFKILTPLGGISIVSNSILSELAILTGLITAMFFRFNLPQSCFIMRWSFIVLLLVKLWPSIVQTDARWNLDEFFREHGADYYNARFRFQGTLKNGLELIPLIIAFPRGAIGGAMALFALLPSSITPRVLLLYFFPFATLLLLLGTSSMVQLAGDAFLGLSLICFYLSDLFFYLLFGSVIKGNVNDLSNDRKAKMRLGTKIAGTILLMIWFIVKLVRCASNSTSEHCMALQLVNITARRAVTILFSFLRNLFLTKLIFADFILITIEQCEPNLSLSFFGMYGKKEKEENEE